MCVFSNMHAVCLLFIARTTTLGLCQYGQSEWAFLLFFFSSLRGMHLLIVSICSCKSFGESSSSNRCLGWQCSKPTEGKELSGWPSRLVRDLCGFTVWRVPCSISETSSWSNRILVRHSLFGVKSSGGCCVMLPSLGGPGCLSPLSFSGKPRDGEERKAVWGLEGRRPLWAAESTKCLLPVRSPERNLQPNWSLKTLTYV